MKIRGRVLLVLLVSFAGTILAQESKKTQKFVGCVTDIVGFREGYLAARPVP